MAKFPRPARSLPGLLGFAQLPSGVGLCRPFGDRPISNRIVAQHLDVVASVIEAQSRVPPSAIHFLCVCGVSTTLRATGFRSILELASVTPARISKRTKHTLKSAATHALVVNIPMQLITSELETCSEASWSAILVILVQKLQHMGQAPPRLAQICLFTVSSPRRRNSIPTLQRFPVISIAQLACPTTHIYLSKLVAPL
ncbi:hypothetical protein BKA62DRAFT_100930 [Auriculariales sp. MPI-PUGE-AT-0066]|nr:hypothetical protein BKA62DRAFT_100930 [Auriculariales sp. MPI-PUGE-AT-0066]